MADAVEALSATGRQRVDAANHGLSLGPAPLTQFDAAAMPMFLGFTARTLMKPVGSWAKLRSAVYSVKVSVAVEPSVRSGLRVSPPQTPPDPVLRMIGAY